jgi:hypothetical protein
MFRLRVLGGLAALPTCNGVYAASIRMEFHMADATTWTPAAVTATRQQPVKWLAPNIGSAACVVVPDCSALGMPKGMQNDLCCLG